VSGLLQPPQCHDRKEMADMQARAGAVEADISRNDLAGGEGIERGEVGALVNISALLKHIDEIGLQFGHSLGLRLLYGCLMGAATYVACITQATGAG
jgi:hypothetical protein